MNFSLHLFGGLNHPGSAAENIWPAAKASPAAVVARGESYCANCFSDTCGGLGPMEDVQQLHSAGSSLLLDPVLYLQLQIYI